MNIEVSNCHDCPFSEYSREESYIFGKDSCVISEKYDKTPIYIGYGESLPSDSIHEQCPLKKLNQVTIKIKTK